MPTSLQKIALKTIRMEAEAITGLKQFINGDFEKAVRYIAKCQGRVVISGIGKSAIIAQKIVATLNSTGTASVFMHAADAIHGDLGIVQQEDVVIIISKSGESPEIKALIPLIKNFKKKLIAILGKMDSYLAKNADFILNTTVKREACRNKLAPTTSTTAQLVMGDALAICLMELNNFKSDDFAKVHPGGMLGKKLYLRVADLYKRNEKPRVSARHSLKDVIMEISAKRLGATAVTDSKNNLIGIITDGDLRRMLEKKDRLYDVKVKKVMTKNPKTITEEKLAVEALNLMQKNSIMQLVVVKNRKYLGFIHLHDLIREGLI